MTRSNLVHRHGARGAALLSAFLLALAGAGCGEKGGSVEQMMTAAKQARDKGNHAAAIIEFKNVIQKAPDHPEARYLLGVTYNDAGDFRSGEKELRRALELRYDSTKVVPPLGKALLALGEHDKVLSEIRVENSAPNETQAEVLTLRALALIALKREKEGRELLEQALVKQPNFPGALIAQARLAATDKKLEDAEGLLTRARQADPGSVDALLLSGDLAQAKGKPDEARASYLKVVEANPENVMARLNLVALEIGVGNFEEAKKQLQQARKIAPGNPLGRYMEALLEFRQGNNTAARDAVLQVLKVAPNHLPSLLLAGAVEYGLGSQAQAQAYLGRFLERQPGNLYARRLLVASLAKGGQVPRAIEALQPGLRQAPDDATLLALAGELSMQNNDLPAAERYFEKAAKADPKNVGARTGLGVSRLASGATDTALSDLEAAVELDSSKYQADVLLITAHLRRKNYDQAMKAVQSLEKKQPKNPLTYNLKAAVYLGKKDVAAARKELEHALELQPNYVAAAVNLAQIDLQEKKPDAARGRLETILQKDKDNVQALLALVNLGPRIGATAKDQVEWLERAGRASPGTVQPQLLLARFHAQSGDAKKALEVVQRTAAAHPDNPEVLDALGSIQIAAGEKNQALATYGKLASLRPDSPVVLFRLANAQAINANPSGATASLNKALSLKPDYLEAQLALAELEVRAGRYPEAMKVARQVQKQAPKSPIGHALEGDILMAEKKYPQAIKAYETAFGMGRSSAIVIKLHAATMRAGKPEEAEARLVQWLKASPEDVAVRLYSAEASLATKKYKQAIEQYEWLLKKSPDNVLVLNNLAWCYQQVKDPRALETAERAYKLKPDNSAVADTLGMILVEQGNTTRALPVLEGAVKGAPNAPAIRYHLAQALLKAGDKTKAVNELERLLSTNQAFPEQAEALALLKQVRGR